MVLSFLTNFCVSLTIFKGRKIELKEKFYKYMLVNSIFNSAYSLINLFNLMSECIILNSVFCLSIFRDLPVQYFKTIVIKYLDNVLKISAALCYILMTINRFLLVGKEHSHFLEKVSIISFRKSVKFILIFSSCLSIVKYFE
jgi:hypothetical protein